MISDVPDRTGARRAHGPAAAARRVAVAALVAAALAGSGCGGGDDEGDTAAPTTTAGGQATTSTQGSTTTGTEGKKTGGGSGNGQNGQSHSIPDVVFAVLTSGDPGKACGEDYVTDRYLNAAYGGKGGCVQAQAPGSVARSLHFNDVITSTKPGRATVRVRPEGGVYDGEKLTLTLVRENGSWKVGALMSNAPVGP